MSLPPIAKKMKFDLAAVISTIVSVTVDVCKPPCPWKTHCPRTCMSAQQKSLSLAAYKLRKRPKTACFFSDRLLKKIQFRQSPFLLQVQYHV